MATNGRLIVLPLLLKLSLVITPVSALACLASPTVNFCSFNTCFIM